MNCIEISPIIAVCVFLEVIIIGGVLQAGSIDRKKILDDIHQEMSKGNMRAKAFILSYPIVGPFFGAIAYPVISSSIIIAVALLSLWFKSVSCT